MSNAADGQIDLLVKARWLAIGLSQTDLAEVLGAAFPRAPKDDKGSNGADAGRLTKIAEALDVSFGCFHSQPAGDGQEQGSQAHSSGLLQSLLDLRLLRSFHELQDDQTKRMLVHLAEQIVKRQADRRGDAG